LFLRLLIALLVCSAACETPQEKCVRLSAKLDERFKSCGIDPTGDRAAATGCELQDPLFGRPEFFLDAKTCEELSLRVKQATNDVAEQGRRRLAKEREVEEAKRNAARDKRFDSVDTKNLGL